MSTPPETTKIIQVNERIFDTGISEGKLLCLRGSVIDLQLKGLFAASLVIACCAGFGCALFCGGFIGAQMMKAKRDRQYTR